MASTGIGTAVKNWKDEEEQKQQGIGTAAYHEPAQGIGTPAYKEPAQGIGTPASNNLNQAQQTQPIQTMQGVSQNTKQKMEQAQQGYQPSQAAQQAQANLQALQANKPQGYTSKYSAALDGILQQIQTPQEFKYEFNGDALFNSLKDQYVQQAKQAAVNAQGMAAGLTGGYGNSYAQMAGNQAYQQNILPLYDKGIEMAQMAYNQHRDKQADKYNQLNALMGMDESDYGRYRDTVSDWQNERNYQTDLYNTEEDRAYNRYANDLNYWTQLAQVENADYRSEQERQEAIRQFNLNYDMQQQQFDWQKETDQRDYDRNVLESDRAYEFQQQQFDENVRQFNENLDWDKMSAQQKYAAEYAMNILAMGQMPSEELLMQAGLSAEDAQKMMAKISSGGGTTQKPKTSTDDWDLPTAGLNVWLSDPANKEAIQQYAQQAAAKDVNNTLRSGQLPNASMVNAAGMNQTDVMKQYMQSNVTNPSAADMMNLHMATGGNVSTYGQKKKKDNN